MDTVELRIAMTEELVRELLWHALAPEALVMTGALNKAIEQQLALRGVALDGYTLSGISVAEAGTMWAELSYIRQQARSWTDSEAGGTQRKDKVRMTSEDSFPASDPPAWTGSEAGSTER
jgi:hypothetical protein